MRLWNGVCWLIILIAMISLSDKYKLPKSTVIKKKNDKFLFLNPSIPDWIVTNVNGAIALKLCNGKRTIKDINSIISKTSKRDQTNELTTFFQRVIEKTSFLNASYKYTAHISYNPYPLHIVHLNLTNKCNLKCIYCYADERSISKDLLQYADYLNIIDSINNIRKNVEIVLTGGEPLISIYTLDIAEYGKKKGNQIHILTNGLLINESNVNRITELCDLIKISLDGSTPKINDRLRGKGSFTKITKAINLLSQRNAQLKISMTVTKENINDIGNMVNKFGSLVSFAPLFKAGRAKSNKNLAITGKEYYKALSSVKGVNPLSYLCSSLDGAKEQKIMKCAIGDAEISISDTGDVYPCHLLHLPQFLAGNIKKQSLESIYKTSNKLMECRNLTVSEIKGCKKCDIRFICGGACRARAFFEKNSINVCGEFCEYEKLSFINGLFDLYQLEQSDE